MIDFEEAFEEDFNKENSNGNANNGDNNSNDKSIDTNGNKLGTSINVLPTVIEENETDSYIPSTSKFNQHQHQQEQKSTDETSWDSYRPSTRKTPVSSSNGLFVSDSEYSPQTQRSTSSLPSQSNSQQQQQQQNNSHHHHYRHRTKTINTTNRIDNPHLQGVNYHLQDQKISNFTSTIKFFKLFTIIIIIIITTITLSSNRT